MFTFILGVVTGLVVSVVAAPVYNAVAAAVSFVRSKL